MYSLRVLKCTILKQNTFALTNSVKGLTKAQVDYFQGAHEACNYVSARQHHEQAGQLVESEAGVHRGGTDVHVADPETMHSLFKEYKFNISSTYQCCTFKAPLSVSFNN